MIKNIFLILLATQVIFTETTYGYEEDSNVVVLTDDNFEEVINKHQHVFVKFYAPWCGHCQKMAPGYSKLAEKVHGEGNGIVIAKLDATVHKKMSTKFGIQGFPTLKFFKSGNAIDYQGEREQDPIYNWIQKKTGPSSKLLLNDEDYEKHSKQKLSVLFLTPEGEEKSLNTFLSLASSYDDVAFAHSHTHQEKLSVTGKYTLVVFRTFDEGMKQLTSEEELTLEQMKTFFESHRYPFVMDFDQESANRIFGQQKTAFFLLTDSTDSVEVQTFREFAKNHQGEMLFSLSTVTTGFGARLAEYVGVKKESDPTARIVSFGEGQLNKFIVNELTTEGLTKSLNDFKSGSLDAHYKSAPIPETNDEAVKVVVGDSFDDMVVTEDKYVLLEAYAPWCGHCKKLEPIYKELAEQLAGETDLVIAKMDATENEHKLMPVTGFPTLRLFKPGNKTPVDYSGDRSKKDLLEFLEKQVGRKFESVKTEDL